MPNARRTELARGIAVIGSTTIDRNSVDGRLYVKPGGATTYAGITYRRHGLPTWAVTNVAASEQQVLAPLAAEQIGLLIGESDRTTRFVNRVIRGERVQEMPARAAPITADQVRTVLRRVGALHLGPLHAADIDPAAYGVIASRGAFAVLDIQGCVRLADGPRITAGVAAALRPALRAARVVKSDLRELDTITAHLRQGLAELITEFGVDEWVVTMGAGGGFIREATGAEHPFAAEPAADPLDPTGAGDVFLAAYVCARFCDGASPGAAARRAARVAAAQVAGVFIALPAFSEAAD